MTLPPVPPPACAAVAAALLAQRAAIVNFDAWAGANGIQGWREGDPVCSWGGIACDAAGNVLQM